MTVFRKQVLRAATYQSPEGLIEVTPERLKHWSDSFKRVRSAGYDVPIHWNHASLDDTANLSPIKRNASPDASKTVGHLEDFQLSPQGDSAILTMSVKKPSAVEAAESNVIHVSPVLWDEWTDGRGQTHKDLIGSVDLVDYPVDYSQGPFEKVQTMSTRKPKITRFSTIAEEPMDDEEYQGNDGDETQEVETPVPADLTPSNSLLTSVLTGLESMKIVLPADTTTDNFLDRLNVALMTVSAQSLVEEENTNVVADPGDVPGEVVSPQIATMSARVKQLEGRLIEQGKADLQKRLKGCLESGRCTPAEARAKESALKVQRMSLVGDKVNSGDLGVWLDSREALPEGCCWDKSEKIKRMSAQAQDQKTNWNVGKPSSPDVESQKKAKRAMLQ
jgi:hypothetical protein